MMAQTRSTRATQRIALDGESLVYRQPRAIRYPPRIVTTVPRICTQRHNIYHTVLSRFQASLSGQPTPLGESLGRSNQSGSKTSQASYGHPRCNLNLVRLFRFSLPLPMFGRIFLSPHPRGHKPTAPFAYCAVPNPRV